MDDDARGTPVGRRVVLGMLGLGALGVAFGSVVSDRVGSAVSSAAGPLADLLPVAGGFRYYSVVPSVPEVPAAEYRLALSGLVERPTVLTFADLAELPQTGLTKDFQCVTGWRVPDVPWGGVLLRDILDVCGVGPTAAALELVSFDGAYTESLTLEQAQRDDVLVVTSMYGAPVTHDHGGPVRLLVAPMYGYKSLKWLGAVEATDAVIPGYWEQRGYDIDAWVGASNGRSDEPIA